MLNCEPLPKVLQTCCKTPGYLCLNCCKNYCNLEYLHLHLHNVVQYHCKIVYRFLVVIAKRCKNNNCNLNLLY